MNYSKAIRVARSLADLSQAELADRANLDRSYLSLIESGKRHPTVESLERLATALRLPFHLLTLLGSESSDIGNVSQAHIDNLSLALTKLLIETNQDEKSRGKNRKTSTQRPATVKSTGAGIRAQRRTRKIS